MLIVISPSKRLDFINELPRLVESEIRFPQKSEKLIKALRQYSPDELSQMMKISMDLAQLNYERYFKWQWPFEKEDARPAVYAFKGDVYDGLDATTLSSNDIAFSQQTLRILSGLYGILRPLDAIMPYRLEMGSKLVSGDGVNLYEVWKKKITNTLNEDLKLAKTDVLLNLASQEYFKVIDVPKIGANIITPIFKEHKNGSYKVVSFYAKKARGLMARFVIKNRINRVEDLMAFDSDGYYYNAGLSIENNLVFTRN